MFSATFPEAVTALTQAFADDVLTIDVRIDEQRPSIQQGWYAVPSRDTDARMEALLRALVLRSGASNLVFCNTKVDCADVAHFLAGEDIAAVALHGDLEQDQRTRTLLRFANGSATVLVATDVAARGLDVENVSAVFNYELPHQAEVYVHRIGRTGRAGREGVAVSLVADREMGRLRNIEEELGGDALPLWDMPSDSLQPGDLVDAAKLFPKVVTIEISGGRKQKLRPGDILGALTSQQGLSGDAVGKIDVLDWLTYVAVDKGLVSQAITLLNRNKIKGRQFRARSISR